MDRLRTRRGPALALTLLLLVGAAACGGDDDSDDSAGNEAGGAVSESTTTTTTEVTTTGETVTTVAGDTGDVGNLAEGPNYESAGGPSGAGCTPGEVDTLPDGWWAGLIIEAEGTTIQFDLLCFFTGDGAVTAAEEDGNTVENDYYVRNRNERTFPVEFASTDVAATCVGSDALTYDCTVGEIIGQHQGGETIFPIVWVHVTGDQPDYIFTQYTP